MYIQSCSLDTNLTWPCIAPHSQFLPSFLLLEYRKAHASSGEPGNESRLQQMLENLPVLVLVMYICMRKSAR